MGVRWSAGALAALALVVASACGTPQQGAAEDPAADSTDPEPTEVTDGPAPTGPMTSDGPLVPREVTSMLATMTPPAPAPRRPAGRLLGADMSWPQCPKGMGIPEKRTQGQPLPTEAARFVVIGLTNSPSFTVNPCLADQVDWARERGLWTAAYAIVTFPDRRTLERLGDEGPYDGSTRLGALRNVGHQAALFNVASMAKAGLPSPIVWVDVEPVASFPWSGDPVANAAVVEGALRGYRDSGVRTGFYSTPVLWREVVGGASFGGPEWRAAGQTSMDEALRRCRDDWSFQGGPGVMGQWVEDNRDRNVTCPGRIRDPARWFHRF